MQFSSWYFQVMDVGTSPEALIGRLYAGHGLKDRLLTTSPPRKVAFGTAHGWPSRPSVRGQIDEETSAVGHAPGSFHPESSPGAEPSLESSFAHQDGMILKPIQAHCSLGASFPKSQRGDFINSPPRIGGRRRSSTVARSKSSLPAAHSKAALTNVGGYQGDIGARALEPDCSPNGGAPSLTCRKGALGQGAAGRSTFAIMSRRDDGASYIRSDKMSPKTYRRTELQPK